MKGKGKREKGTGKREKGKGKREKGKGKREKGKGKREKGKGKREKGKGKRERTCIYRLGVGDFRTARCSIKKPTYHDPLFLSGRSLRS
jgi:hypothetical protein